VDLREGDELEGAALSAHSRRFYLVEFAPRTGAVKAKDTKAPQDDAAHQAFEISFM